MKRIIQEFTRFKSGNSGVLLFMAVCAIFAFSCKSPEERLEGRWRIESYSCAGADSMALIKKANMDGKLIFQVESRQDDRFAINKRVPGKTAPEDTFYSYSGNWIYDRPFLRFKFINFTISTYTKLIYHSEKDTTDFEKTVPYALLRGDWLVAKEGSRTLKLTKIGRKVRMELKRI